MVTYYMPCSIVILFFEYVKRQDYVKQKKKKSDDIRITLYFDAYHNVNDRNIIFFFSNRNIDKNACFSKDKKNLFFLSSFRDEKYFNIHISIIYIIANGFIQVGCVSIKY